MDMVAHVDSVLAKPLLRGWSHVLAFVTVAVLGVTMLAVADASASDRLWLAVYVAGTLTMFGVSALYHRLRWHDRGRLIMRRLDHSAIFLAIAGAYTPVMAVGLDGWQKPLVLGAAWGGTIVGMTLEWLPRTVPRPLFTAIYVIVGWSAAIAFPQLHRTLGAGFWLVLGGGLLYTVGAVVYAMKWPDPWPKVFGFHEVFHLFTLAGAGCHLAAIAFYVVPLM
ncbi:MAG: hemolysin [Ilumatobacteraceae bacterium]|jgi:hemolysin III